VQLNFNSQGAALFTQITGDNIGHSMAIFLDGQIISVANIQEKIPGGTAIISGGFTAESAKALVTNLNLGALPVPITLESTASIGAILGDQALRAGVLAGLIGFIILSIFMILWYRLPGVVAVVSLVIYSVMMLALFKLIPVVLTSAGIALNMHPARSFSFLSDSSIANAPLASRSDCHSSVTFSVSRSPTCDLSGQNVRVIVRITARCSRASHRRSRHFVARIVASIVSSRLILWRDSRPPWPWPLLVRPGIYTWHYPNGYAVINRGRGSSGRTSHTVRMQGLLRSGVGRWQSRE